MSVIIFIDVLLFIYTVKLFYDMYRALAKIRNNPDLSHWMVQQRKKNL
jgi:hypothetical protein